MEIWAGLLGAWIVASAIVTWRIAGQQAERWGVVRVAGPIVAEGAYRAPSLGRMRLRGAPAAVRWSAGLGFAWAGLTLLAFTPLGFILSLALLDAGRTWPLALAFVGCSLDGLVLCWGLVAAGAAILGGEGARLARGVAIWSAAHHAFVLAIALLASTDGWAELPLMAAPPCLIGLAHAFALHRAAGLQPA